jgi:hypothetical protein
VRRPDARKNAIATKIRPSRFPSLTHEDESRVDIAAFASVLVVQRVGWRGCCRGSLPAGTGAAQGSTDGPDRRHVSPCRPSAKALTNTMMITQTTLAAMRMDLARARSDQAVDIDRARSTNTVTSVASR